MEPVILKPSPSASKWTKERLKRHSGRFIEQDRSHLPHGGKDCVLFQNENDNWLAWFPISEIIIVKE